MSRDVLYTTDTLKVRVTVTNSSGAAMNLTGATFTAFAGKPGSVTAGTPTVVDIPGGLVDVVFAAGALVAPYSTAQLHMTLAGETQTVWSAEYTVAVGLTAP